MENKGDEERSIGGSNTWQSWLDEISHSQNRNLQRGIATGLTFCSRGAQATSAQSGVASVRTALVPTKLANSTVRQCT